MENRKKNQESDLIILSREIKDMSYSKKPDGTPNDGTNATLNAVF